MFVQSLALAIEIGSTAIAATLALTQYLLPILVLGTVT
jgi:hypothetical protein